MNNKDFKIPESIISILEKYYDGSTTAEEERLLKNFFENNEVPDTFLSDRLLFSFNNRRVGTIFPEETLWTQIKESERKLQKRSYYIKLVTSVAASIVLIISISFWYSINQRHKNLYAKDTFTDPKEAYLVAQKYFGLVSNKLSYAYAEIRPIEKINIPSKLIKPIECINQGFHHLDQLSSIQKSTAMLEQLSVFSDYINVDSKVEIKK